MPRRHLEAVVPLSSRVTLGQLLALAPPPGVYGVWIADGVGRGGITPIRLCSDAGGVTLLLAADLAALTARTVRVLVRRRGRIACLPSDTLRTRRQLEITRLDGGSTLHPLGALTPEIFLADCAAAGRSVAGSRIVYSVDSPRSPSLG
jgi:hypothetical protein